MKIAYLLVALSLIILVVCIAIMLVVVIWERFIDGDYFMATFILAFVVLLVSLAFIAIMS